MMTKRINKRKIREEIDILKKAMDIVYDFDENSGVEISTNYVEANIERIIDVKEHQLGIKKGNPKIDDKLDKIFNKYPKRKPY